MLKGISPLISPELIKILMEMGHGDEIVISDANFPAAACAKRLIRCDGHGAPEILDAVLKLFPLDYAVNYTAVLMSVSNGNPKPEIWDLYSSIIGKHDMTKRGFDFVERFSFYERSRQAYAIVATGEKARFANLIIKKGIISDL